MTMKMSVETAKSDVKAVKNTIKEEKKVMKEDKKDVKVSGSAVIMDAKPETKAKTKALNAKKETKVNKKKKTPAKKEAKTSKPKKGGGKMSHNENLAKVLEVTAKNSKDLNYNVMNDRAGVPSTFQLKRGGDNIVTIRKTDIVACRPRDFFAKGLINKTPYFKLYDKKSGAESFTHFTHIKKAVEVDVFKTIVAKAITSKKTVGEWKSKVGAIGKARVSKKTDRQKVADLQASIKRQQKELEGLKSAKAKASKKAKTKKPARSKVAPVIAKVAETIA